MTTRYFQAYLPVPTPSCAHDGIANAVTDTGIVLGPFGKPVSIPVQGKTYRLAKIMCTRCGNVGGALPMSAKLNEAALDPQRLPDRDVSRPEVQRAGIRTEYKGTRFRSRLEARWAAFFDLIGWRWTYEPIDAGGWIPDFMIHGEKPFLVEVGPCATDDDYRAKAAKPLRHIEHPTLIVGVSAILEHPEHGTAFGYAGLLANEFANGGAYHAFWTHDDANRLLIYGDDASAFPHRVTWEAMWHCGDHWIAMVLRRWNEAGNTVQWNAA